MEVVLYSTHCSKCNILSTKLHNKGIEFSEINDPNVMIAKGMTSAPYLEVDGKMMDFGEANKWVNELE